MLAQVKERLQAFGYVLQSGDKALLAFALDRAVSTIKNDCNLAEVPEGLRQVAVDMAVGEFLQAKKTFAPESLAGLDLDTAIKQVQTGDTNVSFAVGEGSLTQEQRLNQLIGWLMNYVRSELSCYRKMRW